ncbi:MAG: hypothetical protein K8T20_00125 [Planctomycetes bacterium]|nr:hypothetical protein [Planctomycetota bacterium]
MTFRNHRTLAAALLALGVLSAGGCHKSRGHSSYSSSGSSIFTTDTFPGAAVHDGDVADDKRAWSPPGTDVILGTLKCTPNGDRGTMMATYGVQSTGISTTNTLMAQYYDGSVWTTPVVLTATDANFLAGSVVFTSIVHAWINTAENAADTASDRDGDCVIFWSANDADGDGALTLDDVNRNLYATYFNSRGSSDISKRYGFQEFASRLSTQDELGEDVTSFGVATDGLCGEARWETGANFYRYGQETTGIVAFWNQRENNDAVLGFDDRALYAAPVQLDAAVASDLPLSTGAGIGVATRITINGMGASDAGTSSEETQVDHQFVSYNGFLAFRVVANNTTAGDDTASHVFDPAGSTYNGATASGEDASLEAVTFDLVTGAAGPAVLLHLTVPVSSTVDTLRNDADFIHKNLGAFASDQQYTFGPDEGLAYIVMFAVESINDTNDSKTDLGDLSGIAMYEVSAPAGTLISANSVSLADPTIADFIDSRKISARISRNGDYVLLAWVQADATGVTADVTIKAAEYLTTRPAEDGTFTILPVSSTLSSPVNAIPDTDGFSINSFAFQDALGYICGQQSDPDVMNLVVDHPDGVTDRLLLSRLTADLLVPVSLGVTTTVLETDDLGTWTPAFNINDDGQAYKITDSGEGGNVFAVYASDVDSTGGTDIRVFAERTGFSSGAGPIDSNVTFREANYQAFTFVSTPPGQEIGVFDPVSGVDSEERPHGARSIHVFFREQKTSESSGNGLALRTRVFDTGDNGLSFGDSFVPNAGTTYSGAFDLDLPFIDPGLSEDAVVRGIAVDGDTVGVWFSETGHIYYQEFNPDSNLGWINDGGVSDPLLVDDDTDAETGSNEPVGFFHLFVARTCTCNTLHGATVFYSKTPDDFSTAERLHVRSRE